MGQILYRNVRGPGVPKGYAMAGRRTSISLIFALLWGTSANDFLSYDGINPIDWM